MAAIPSSSTPIQQAGAQSTLPVSESLMFAIGGVANYCLTNAGKVGDVVMSDLSVSAFQSQRDTTWILSDGTDVTGSEYATLTGLTAVPDRRGTYPRACDNGRGLDPNGSQAPGNYIADQVGPHLHNIPGFPVGGGSGTSFNGLIAESFTTTNGETANSTGAETAPKTVYSNFFVKINT